MKDTKALLEGGGDEPNPLRAKKATVVVVAVRRRRTVGNSNRRGISVMVGVWRR